MELSTVIYIIAFLVGLVIYAEVSRSVFRVNRHIENQEIMIQLLSQLLIQQGLTVEEVNKLLNRNTKQKKKGRF